MLQEILKFGYKIKLLNWIIAILPLPNWHTCARTHTHNNAIFLKRLLNHNFSRCDLRTTRTNSEVLKQIWDHMGICVCGWSLEAEVRLPQDSLSSSYISLLCSLPHSVFCFKYTCTFYIHWQRINITIAKARKSQRTEKDSRAAGWFPGHSVPYLASGGHGEVICACKTWVALPSSSVVYNPHVLCLGLVQFCA